MKQDEIVDYYSIIAFSVSTIMSIVIPFIIGYINRIFKFRLNLELVGSQIVIIYITTVIFLGIIPLRRLLKKYFLYDSDKKKLLKNIFLSIFIGLITVCIIELTRTIPLYFGSNELPIAKGQAVNELAPLSIQSLFFSGLLPACSEEFIFRFSSFLLFLLILMILRHISQKDFSKNRIFYILWLLISSMIFALMHLPSPINFYMYFVPGLIFGLIFLKYGLVYSMLTHCSFNYFANLGALMAYSIFHNLK